MSPVKEKIYGVVELMNEQQAEQFWALIRTHFLVTEKAWNNIPEEAPDEIDLQMLKEIEEAPECHEFVPAPEAYKELGLA